MATKRIAVIATIYSYLKHAQHFSDRFFVGYPYGGRWHRPDCQLVSLYVDQKSAGDQSEDRAREFGGQVYPTIAEALRCGGGELACNVQLVMVAARLRTSDLKNQVRIGTECNVTPKLNQRNTIARMVGAGDYDLAGAGETAPATQGAADDDAFILQHRDRALVIQVTIDHARAAQVPAAAQCDAV